MYYYNILEGTVASHLKFLQMIVCASLYGHFTFGVPYLVFGVVGSKTLVRIP
jgi:hypothetical protein